MDSFSYRKKVAMQNIANQLKTRLLWLYLTPEKKSLLALSAPYYVNQALTKLTLRRKL